MQNPVGSPPTTSSGGVHTPTTSHEGVDGAFCWCHSQLSVWSDCALLAVVARLNFTGQGSSRGSKGVGGGGGGGEAEAPEQLLLFVYATQQHTSGGVPRRRLAGPPSPSPPTLPA